MASERESDVQETVDWGRKWLIDFNAGETQLVSFDWSNNTGAIDAVFLAHYFTSAKKMPTQKLYDRFHVGKSGIHIGNFQKIVFFQRLN